MKREIILQLHSSFELAVNETDGVEYWFARDLQELLGYTKWENFTKVIDKAKTACTNAKQEVSDHFLDVRKMVFCRCWCSCVGHSSKAITNNQQSYCTIVI